MLVNVAPVVAVPFANSVLGMMSVLWSFFTPMSMILAPPSPNVGRLRQKESFVVAQ